MEMTLFQNPEIAKTVLQRFLSINDQMNNSIRAVQSKSLPEELKTFKRGVGHVICNRRGECLPGAHDSPCQALRNSA